VCVCVCVCVRERDREERGRRKHLFRLSTPRHAAHSTAIHLVVCATNERQSPRRVQRKKSWAKPHAFPTQNDSAGGYYWLQTCFCIKVPRRLGCSAVWLGLPSHKAKQPKRLGTSTANQLKPQIIVIVLLYL